MKTVLVVDDEPSVLFALSEGLTDRRRGIAVVTAANGREAVERLEAQPVDLVVTDLRMPEVDGFELLAWLRRHQPALPVILMTALGRAETSARLGTEGRFECLTKPFEVEDLKRRIREMLGQGLKGRVENISLASFLQLLEMERKTCTLSVASLGRTGKLYFRAGSLAGAETDGLEGQAAALEIVTWDQADIEIAEGCPQEASALAGDLRFFLMEGMRLKDEREKLAAEGETVGAAIDALGEEVEEAEEPEAVAATAVAPPGAVAAAWAEELLAGGLQKIKGAAALLLADVATGLPVATAGGDAPAGPAAPTAAAVAQLLREQHRITERAGLHHPVQEALLTAPESYIVVRCLTRGPDWFLLLLLDRARANLSRAQLDLVAIQREMEDRFEEG